MKKNIKTEVKENPMSDDEKNLLQSFLFTDLPYEVRNRIYALSKNIPNLRLTSKQINNEITSAHGPHLEELNTYLSFFGGYVLPKTLTLNEYLIQFNTVKDPFLDKQEIEINRVKLWGKNNWQFIAPNRKEAIYAINTRATCLSEAQDRDRLLNEIHVDIIKPKLESLTENNTYLDLSSLALTRLPNQLFTDDKFKTYWENCTRLNLHNNHLMEIPIEMTFLKDLQTLDLSDNHIECLPDEIQHWKNLQTLTLRSNQLNSLPEVITHLQKLNILNLSHNQLTTLPEKIYDIETLTHLDVTANLIPEAPHGLNSLKLLKRSS